MPGTHTNLLYHVIFSTKHREPLIDSSIREPLYRYLAGVMRNKGGQAIEVGGVADHVHLLLHLRSTMPVADAVRLVKSNSSAWLRAEMDRSSFRWQSGYGAFTVSQSGVEATRAYIRNQEAHHAERTFEDEFVAFLDKNQIDYDPEEFWD